MSQLITRAYAGKTFLFREDGYINMTKTAKEFGKRIDFFFINTAAGLRPTRRDSDAKSSPCACTSRSSSARGSLFTIILL